MSDDCTSSASTNSVSHSRTIRTTSVARSAGALSAHKVAGERRLKMIIELVAPCPLNPLTVRFRVEPSGCAST